MKSQAISIHIGVNAPNYGAIPTLEGCENDARDMAAVMAGKFDVVPPFLGPAAKVAAVKQAITEARGRLASDGILLVTFSGHGGATRDLNGDERDGVDETWCLFDYELVDDELYSLWAQFETGTRILIVSDSCRSAGVVKLFRDRELLLTSRAIRGRKDKGFMLPAVKAIPLEVAEEVFRQNEGYYSRVQTENPLGRGVCVEASILLLSACQEWQSAADGRQNSPFTAALLHVIRKGTVGRTYAQLRERVAAQLPTSSIPALKSAGRPWAAFEEQVPFSTGSPGRVVKMQPCP